MGKSNEEQKMLQFAIKLAVEAHSLQTRHNGDPYILHPMRVMLQMVTIRLKIVAILHDVVEDTSITLEEIGKHFTPEITKSIGALTHEKIDTYDEYIGKIMVYPKARLVKMADILDNLKSLDIELVGIEKFNRVEEKYKNAYTRLMGK